MNGASEAYPAQGQTRSARAWSWRAVAGGALAEAVGGIAAIVLTILALVGVVPMELTAIAAIVVGAALFCEGGTVAAAYRRAVSREGAQSIVSDVGSGITVEFLAGLASIVLGILALFINASVSLLGAAAIVLGAAMLLSSRLPSEENLPVSSSGQLMIGLAAVVLGILAFATASPAVLLEVAFLCLGVGVLMAGSFQGMART